MQTARRSDNADPQIPKDWKGSCRKHAQQVVNSGKKSTKYVEIRSIQSSLRIGDCGLAVAICANKACIGIDIGRNPCDLSVQL